VPVDSLDPKAEPIFAAYRHLRIMHQLQYANYKLRESDAVWPLSARAQAALLSNTILLCILGLFAIHIGIALDMTLARVFDWKALIPLDWIPGMHVVALGFAIIALAVRALEEGLKLDLEIERYQQYKSAVRAIRDRFDEGESLVEKVEVMREMERLAFDEMCDFLRTHSQARFII
jgi:hypothetical protein